MSWMPHPVDAIAVVTIMSSGGPLLRVDLSSLVSIYRNCSCWVDDGCCSLLLPALIANNSIALHSAVLLNSVLNLCSHDSAFGLWKQTTSVKLFVFCCFKRSLWMLDSLHVSVVLLMVTMVRNTLCPVTP